MKLFIYCRHNRDTLMPYFEQHKNDYTFLEMEAHLHMQPELLHKTLQKIIDEQSHLYENILLFLGSCATHAVHFEQAQCPVYALSTPDCLKALLPDQYRDLATLASTFLVTKSWMHSESNLPAQFKALTQTYCADKAAQIFRLYFKNYTSFLYLCENTQEPECSSLKEIGRICNITVQETRLDKQVIEAFFKGIPHKCIKKMNS